MRIALLSDGANVHTRRWTDYFAACGDDVLLLTLQRASGMGVPTRRLGSRLRPQMLAYTLAVPGARRALARFDPDLVNAHFLPNYGWMAWLMGAHPWVLSTWGSDVLVNPHRSIFHRWRARRVLRAADLLTSDARMLSAAIQELAGADLSVLTVPMGIDRVLFDAGAPTGDRAPVILHNRNLEAVYDVHTVLRSFARFTQEHPDWRLRLAGDGTQRAELEGLAAELGLGDRAQFLGRLDRETLMDELRAARIYLSASLSDSTSVSLLEAMALGAQPVLSDIPANREWIAEAPRAHYFAAGDSEALAHALAAAAALPAAARSQAAAENRADIEAGAIWEENMADLRTAFLALAEGWRSPR